MSSVQDKVIQFVRKHARSFFLSSLSGTPHKYGSYTTLRQLAGHQTTQTTEAIRLSLIIRLRMGLLHKK
ncbi:Hypothetical protein CINCED_3A023783 [Cinara cedri]|uniref:Uncharacterized protein n=1 Tax=Cinara cedri TaxID=506608 RepID=A0A5E4N6C2_9HEMI|nr:Hypothetical protein CINCED_3A023783 [Cinara cedri]